MNEKVALVTGASRGIGAAIAKEMAKQGAKVVGTATSEAGAEKITEMLKAADYEGRGFCLNVNEKSSVEKLLSDLESTYGMPDILINNAGITRDNLTLRMKEDEWMDVINTNLNSIFHLTKQCLKPMMKKRWGRVINISSIVAVTGNPGQPNYCAAKAGMIGFSKALALEVATRGMTVNVVAPGFIETDMTAELTDAQKEMILQKVPMGKIGHVDDIAHMVAYLSSDHASYITGQTIHINGGMYTC